MLNRELNYKYPGMEPYVFISVSSGDLDRVEPFIDRLDREGIRRWYYVKGIEYSADYRSAFAERLKNCTTFLAFLSPNSAKSEDCRDEIYYARDNKKDMFFVYLDEPKSVKLPDGVEFIVHSKLYIEYQKSPTEEAFLRELCGAKCMQKCRKPAEEPTVPEAQESQPVLETQVSEIQYDSSKFEIDGTTLVRILRTGKSIKVPDGVTDIKYPVFAHSATIERIILPSQLRVISGWVFSGCEALIEVDIPDTVEMIEIGSFLGCKNLEQVKIPKGIKKIYYHAFEGCKKLTILMSRYSNHELFNPETMILWNPDNRPIEFYD